MGAERSLLSALRRAENDAAAAWQAIHNETIDAAKGYQAQNSRHGEQLRTVEELGYERGLADGRAERHSCPICTAALNPDDICATDIEMGICHAACLEGSPTVNLDTGEPTDGPIATYRYDSLPADPQ
jgi:hypothetical protein